MRDRRAVARNDVDPISSTSNSVVILCYVSIVPTTRESMLVNDYIVDWLQQKRSHR